MILAPMLTTLGKAPYQFITQISSINAGHAGSVEWNWPLLSSPVSPFSVFAHNPVARIERYIIVSETERFTGEQREALSE